MPRASAARVLFPCFSCNTLSMCFFSTPERITSVPSAVVEDAPRMFFGQIFDGNTITFRHYHQPFNSIFNSRTLPGQLYCVITVIASGSRIFFCLFLQKLSRKWSIKTGMSSRLSRSGGRGRVITFNRKYKSSLNFPFLPLQRDLYG